MERDVGLPGSLLPAHDTRHVGAGYDSHAFEPFAEYNIHLRDKILRLDTIS
jgi:hypothetical protein